MDTEDPVPTDAETGIVFPRSGQGRSTSALGRAIVADALRGVDPVGARAAEGETSWRREYGSHFRRLVEAGLLSRAAAVGIAGNGLACLYEQMRYSTMDGELPLAAAVTMPVAAPLQTVTDNRHRRGRAGTGPAVPRRSASRRGPAAAPGLLGRRRSHRAVLRRGGTTGGRQSGVAFSAGASGRRARRRGRDEPADRTAALGRRRGRGGPAPPGRVAAPGRHGATVRRAAAAAGRGDRARSARRYRHGSGPAA